MAYARHTGAYRSSPLDRAIRLKWRYEVLRNIDEKHLCARFASEIGICPITKHPLEVDTWRD